MELPETGGLESAPAQASEIEARDHMDQATEVPLDPEVAIQYGSQEGPRGTKRRAESEGDDVKKVDYEDKESRINDGNGDENGDGDGDGDESNDVDITTEPQELSKNQLKKLKRRKMTEEKKKDQRVLRKEKRRDKKQQKRLDKEAEIAAAAAEGREPVFNDVPKQPPKCGTTVPISIIVDCQFEKYMMEKEVVSLSNQVTRCYSDNRNAQYHVNMFISSYGGQIRNRHETCMENQHLRWKNVHFVEGDFVEAAKEAQELMKGPQGGTMVELLQQSSAGKCLTLQQPTSKNAKKSAPAPEPEAEDVDKSIVYLTADSPYTLDRLEPNTCYVIGGIIDKNREKGLCYKIARQRNVRTAKLPIGDFMVMQSRHILATNHVMEIMLKWLELGNWGAAFMKVIPMRKGGKLKEDENTPDADEEATKQTVEDKPEEDDVAVEVIQIDASKPDEQGEGDQESQEAAEVEGENAKEGLTNNSLDQQRWSAPPIEPEKVEAPCSDAIS